eukprot:s1044_g15.t1
MLLEISDGFVVAAVESAMMRRHNRALCLLYILVVPAFITDGYSFFARIASLRRRKSSPPCEGLPHVGVPPNEVQGLAALRSAVATSGMEPLADPLTLLRFYRARNRDVDAAAEMYNTTMAWRSSYSIQELMDAFGTEGHYAANGGRATDPIHWNWVPHPNTLEAELAYRHSFFTRLPPEISPEPVLIWRAGHADYQGIVREDLVDIMIKAFIVHLEDALQASRAASLRKGKLVRARLIVDCDGLGFENIRYIPILKKIITLGKSYYPEVAATVTVVRAPGFSATFYNLVKHLLPKLLQEKISLLGRDFREGLMKHTGLDAKSLPDFLGGDVTDVKFAKVHPVPSNALDYLSQPEFQS